MVKHKRILYILIAVDQLVNTIFGGMPDETISAKAWRMQDKKKRYKVLRCIIDKLFWFDPDHCRTSYLSEIEKHHLPDEYHKQ